MNIVIVTLANGSDHQRYTKVVANRLSLTDNVLLICTSQFDADNLNEKVRVNKALCCDKSRIEIKALNIKTWVNIFMDVSRFRPDVIHFFCAHPLNLILSLLFFKIRKIYTIHDFKPHPEENVSVFVSIYNQIVKKIANIIVVHSQLAKTIIDSSSQKETIILPLCGPSVKSDYKKDCTSILFFGRIRPYKGLELFIEAAEAVISEIPDVKFVIAGEGDIGKYLTLIKHKDNFTIYNKYISEEETDALFEECRVVVLPYYSATQSGVIPLAYSFNKPVIASRVGAIPEMVVHNKNGILIEPEIKQLAESIKRIYRDDNLYENMCIYIKKTYFQNYSEDNMGSRFEQFYKNLDNRMVEQVRGGKRPKPN
ncbi:glycosyltransferase family 4 protein [Sporomusa sp. GT1]|uniref:glycosyltransferase family 4 protein n=1 Tax=Sporomusa sp. GT1 TaxID=1534747 RepID=UPI001668ED88|nr:glycosyltransferase family 4 protein [Sporomusa sp. GT1]